jgi:hypothetical protein
MYNVFIDLEFLSRSESIRSYLYPTIPRWITETSFLNDLFRGS